MLSVHEHTQRIPAALWSSLTDVCYQQDMKFIQDVSKLLGIPANDIKRRIFGIRGETTLILSERDPWHSTTQCTVMELGKGRMWRRCSNIGEARSYCWDHRKYKHASETLRLYDDPYFSTMPKRYPVRYMGDIVWVCENGSVMKQNGELDNVHIDVRLQLASSIPADSSSLPISEFRQEKIE
jgi:hypothetical protein